MSSQEDRTRARVIISGRVQGVYFRMETRRTAQRLGVAGWVRNLPDGTVEGVFEGSQEQVADLIDWCRQGPPMAAVSNVDVDWSQATGEFEDFSIA